jgi:predicted dehydrogenase
MKPFRLGLIGTGRIGRVHATAIVQAAARTPLHLVAVCDLDLQSAIAMANTFGAEVQEIDKMGERDDLDAIILATPPNSHEELGTLFLRKRIGVLCEKPISLNPTSAQRLIDAAREHHETLSISSKFLFADGVVKTIGLLRSGAIGKPSRLAITFSLGIDLSNSWYVNETKSGGGVLVDRGPQAFDLIRARLGRPMELRATAVSGSRYAVEDAVRLDVWTEDGGFATCELSWRATSDSDVYAHLITEEAEIDLGWSECRIRLNGGAPVRFASGYNQGMAFASQITAFAKNVNGEGPFPTDPEGALETALAIDAAYRSGLSGECVLL